MFKFLKDKLKKAVSSFSKNVEKEAEIKEEIVEVEEKVQEIPEGQPEILSEAVEEAQSSKTASAPESKILSEPVIAEIKKEDKIIEEEKPVKEQTLISVTSGASEKITHSEPEDETVVIHRREDLEEEDIVDKEEKAEEHEKDLLVQEVEGKNKEFELAMGLAKEDYEADAEEKVVVEKKEEEKKEEVAEEVEEKKIEKKKKEPEIKKKGFFGKIFGKKEEVVEERKPEPEVKEKSVEEKIKEEITESKDSELLAELKEPEIIKDEIIIEKPEEAAPEEEVIEEFKEELEEDKEEPIIEPEKKGFFARIKQTFTTVKISDEKFDKIFWDLELAMMENNVAIEVIEKIKSDLKENLTSGRIAKKSVKEIIIISLRNSIKSLFEHNKNFDLIKTIKKSSKPYVISFIGVNGSGKTTNMAKVANLLMKNNLKVVFAASDTFRAAAIQQLQEHADNLGVKMIKHEYKSDPAAVAFDAIKHAKAKKIDVVLIDTAGRLHSNDNLMNELKKLIRVNKPDLKIFVGESITGNDCVEQAKLFDEAVGIDAIILAKADVDEKGGAAISISYITKKPIIYLGVGQRLDDLEKFSSEKIIEHIF